MEDTWLDKNGEEQTALRKVGVSFSLKGGGMRHKIYSNVSISGNACHCRRRKRRVTKG